MEKVESILKHYGILGMRWGVRRERGADGRVTNRIESKDVAAKQRMRRDVKARRTLSDEELVQRIARIEKEKKLRELTDSEINAGRKVATDILKSAGTKTAGIVLSGAMLYAIKAVVSGEMNLKELSSYLAPKPGRK